MMITGPTYYQQPILGAPVVYEGAIGTPVLTQPMIVEASTTQTYTQADGSVYYLIKDAQGQFQIVKNPLASALTGTDNVEIPTMPTPSGSRPWTLDAWLQWNLLEHNGTAHPDSVFSKQYGYEPFLILML